MIRRIVAAVLWFSAGWYLGAELALVLSLSPLLGPMLGGAAAIFIVTSPGRIMWHTRSRSAKGGVGANPHPACHGATVAASL